MSIELDKALEMDIENALAMIKKENFMERMKITEIPSVYRVIEQPGDATRYNHLIVIDGNLAYVHKGLNGGGAGLDKSTYFDFFQVEVMAKKWEGKDPHDVIADIEEWANSEGENPFTFASAMRSAYSAFQKDREN